MNNFKIDEDELKKTLNEDLKIKNTTNAPINVARTSSPIGRSVPQKESDLFGEFDTINNEYNFDMNDLSGFKEETLDLEKIKFDNISDDELAKKAEDSLSDYYNSNKGQINDKANSDKQVLESNKDKWLSTSEKVKEELEGNYNVRKETAKKDAVKRGLARSSIIINKIEAFDKGKLDEYTKIDKELTKSLNDIDTQISMLESAKESSLKNFDISYSAKLTDKINSLKAEQSKKMDEVIKYNNEIEKKEKDFAASQATSKQKYEQDLIKKKQDLIKFAKEYGDDKLLEKKYLEKLTVARTYFDSMPKAEAINILLHNGAYKAELGEKWYELYDYINGKKA